jgi:NAD(P)-dependent dehydrogenase (short-subunit alcohol dehydrogenase family)
VHDQLRFIIADDFADPAKLEDAAARCVEALGGKVDILINNLGAGNLGQTTETTSAASLAWHFHLNVTSALVFTQACRAGLIDAQGSVVNLSSVAGE